MPASLALLQVYALGSNGAGCLGLGDMHSTLAPKQVGHSRHPPGPGAGHQP